MYGVDSRHLSRSEFQTQGTDAYNALAITDSRTNRLKNRHWQYNDREEITWGQFE